MGRIQMTCFFIVVSFPEEFPRRSMKAMNEKRMQILLRTRHPQYFKKTTLDGYEYEVALCDEDAIQFLNDIPQPLYVKEIRHQYTPNCLLFSNRWLSGAQETNWKPRSVIEKGVFWAAKATERWTPKHKIETC